MKNTHKGYTFRDPSGNLDYRIFDTISGAQSQAAFNSERPYSHMSWPSDWDRAYKQGFRIVPVKMTTTGTSRAAWKKAKTDKSE